jgi:3-polyprenyl-4-hydroxybenzoate decarboxylase
MGVATRFQADRDLMVVSGALGSKLDPTTDNGIGAKMRLDATAPVTAPELAFKRIRIKGEEDVDLATALQSDPAPRLRGCLRRLGHEPVGASKRLASVCVVGI